MAVAALAAAAGWSSVLSDVSAGVLGPRPELGPAVLELFRSVPEEADSPRLVTAGDGSELRSYRDALRGDAGVMLGLCEHAVRSTSASGGDAETTGAVLRCLQSWIRVVDMDPELIRASPLFGWVFDILAAEGSSADPDGGFEGAVDVVVELLRSYPSHVRGTDGLVRDVIPRVMALGRGPLGRAAADGDEDGVRGYVRVITEMGESYLSLILSHEELDQASLVELVLRCSGVDDGEVACITLHFWYRFVIGLEDLQPFEFRQIKIDSFAPQLERLLGVCVGLLRYPRGAEGMSRDRLDDVEGMRLGLCDAVEDCCRLLGGETVLRALGGPLREECARVASLPPGDQADEWHGMEAHLAALSAISLYVPPDDASVVPFVAGLIPQLPPGSVLLRATACRVAGRYASWLGLHPDSLGPLLPYLATSLGVPGSASQAATAIREVCERCHALGDSVLELYEGITAARERHQDGGGGEFVLGVKAELEVLEGVCKAVSGRAADDPAVVNRLATPVIEGLRRDCREGSSAGPKRVAAHISRLTTLVQHLELPRRPAGGGAGGLGRSDFILSLMRETWPLLDASSRLHPRDFDCGEKLCRLHKHALRGCGPADYAPMLEGLAAQIVESFGRSLSSPYLYLASVVVSEYGPDPSRSALLSDMVTRLSGTVFENLRTVEDLTAHPDVVEELFFLAGRMVDYCPTPLVRGPLLVSLLQCSAMGMTLHHRDANRGTLSFLESAVSYSLGPEREEGAGGTAPGSSSSRRRRARPPCPDDGANRTALESAIRAHGRPLAANLALALLGDLPAYRLDSGSGSIAGVLHGLNSLCGPDLVSSWIGPALAGAPEHARGAFLVALRGRVGRDEFNSCVRRFSSVCERSKGGTFR